MLHFVMPYMKEKRQTSTVRSGNHPKLKKSRQKVTASSNFHPAS